MESLLASVLILALVSFSADHVCSHEIYASENVIPVGGNVTLSSRTRVTSGTWDHNTNIIVLMLREVFQISSIWQDRVTFNSTSSELSIRSLQLPDSGTYRLQALDLSFTGETVLSVQEPISNVTLRANATNLVEFNDTAFFTCSVSNGSSLSYVWLNGSSEVTARERVQRGDGGSTLTIVSVTRYDQGPFRCNVSNGISDEISGPVHLSISYGPSNTTMTTIPMKDVYITGSNITLSCSAESDPPATIQWAFDGMDLTHSGSQLQLKKVTLNHTGSYKCVFYNNVTSRFSYASEMIRIMEPISAVMVDHVGGLPIADELFNLTCEVTGHVDYIRWWRNGQVLSANNETVFYMDNKTLILNPVQRSDNGDYQCEAFNAVSNKASSTYRLYVNYGPEKPKIMGRSKSLTGQLVTLNCSASSNPPSHYRWFFNGSPAANTSEYVIGPLTLNMSGMYTCMASNNITRRDSTAYKMLTVFAPVNMATVEMAGAPPIQNHTFTLICETAGSVESRYWMKDGWPLHADSRRVLSIDNTTLTFDPVLRSDNGRYQCEASNALSNLTSTNFTLRVMYGPWNVTITGPELAMTGSSVTLKCSALSYPTNDFRWLFNGALVANTSEYVTGPLTSKLSGEYTCIAYNNMTGKSSTANKMLTVIDPIKDVEIETPLTPAIEGDSYMLRCNVTIPPDYIYWMKNGERLYADNRTMLSMENKTVTFNPVERYDSGDYQCMASNAVSNFTSPPYTLRVNFGPGETSISGPSLAETGDYALFNCSAPSWPPSHFSWWFNDSLVANISMFKAGPLYLNMSGYYTCVAYNDVTEKNSKNSTMLTVIEAIQSVMVKSNTIPIASKNLTLSCEVIGPYNSIYWKKDNMRLAMNSSTMNSSMSYYTGSNSLHFNPVTVYDDGIYQCVATNSVRLHTSPDYKLLVNYGPLSVVINGPFSVQLGSVLTVSLSCSADSRPTSEYQWLFNDQPSVVGTSSVLTIWAKKENMGNYTCKATNPVTNITMSQTEAFIVSHASALPLQSRGGLILMALFALLLPVVNDLLTH